MFMCVSSLHLVVSTCQVIGRNTPPRMPIRGKEIISTKPGPKRMFMCFFFFILFVYFTTCFSWPYAYLFHKLVARYSVFVPRVSLNTDWLTDRPTHDQPRQITCRAMLQPLFSLVLYVQRAQVLYSMSNRQKELNKDAEQCDGKPRFWNNLELWHGYRAEVTRKRHALQEPSSLHSENTCLSILSLRLYCLITCDEHACDVNYI